MNKDILNIIKHLDQLLSSVEEIEGCKHGLDVNRYRLSVVIDEINNDLPILGTKLDSISKLLNKIAESKMIQCYVREQFYEYSEQLLEKIRIDEKTINKTFNKKRKSRKKKINCDFDIFLCHNGKDKPFVKNIGLRLREKGITPWLDEWELPPGLMWQPILEKIIKNIKSAAVFIGINGIGPWQDLEQYAFIRQFVKRNCPVIPVILSNCNIEPELPVLLEGMTIVDFRLKDPDPIQQLIWGIESKAAQNI